MASVLDIVTLAEVRAALDFGASDTADDGDLARVITSASHLLDSYFGEVVIRTITNERHDPTRAMALMLRHRPVSSVTSVVVDGVTLAGTGYRVKGAGDETNEGMLYRVYGSNYAPWVASQPEGIVVTYEAGRYATTADVPAYVKDACLHQIRHMVRPMQHGVGEISEFDMPAVQAATMGPARGLLAMLPGWRSVGLA